MGPDADNAISYRLSMNHPTDTYAVEELDTDPRPTKASQEKLSGSVGGQPDLTRLLVSHHFMTFDEIDANKRTFNYLTEFGQNLLFIGSLELQAPRFYDHHSQGDQGRDSW